MSKTAILNVSAYSKMFLNSGGVLDTKYSRPASRDERAMISALAGSDTSVDTPLEISLLSYYAGVVNIRPVEADKILPAKNPKLADLKLGAAVFQEAQLLRFLGNTTAAGRHEGMLKFITDRGNVSRKDIEAYYKQNIAAYVSEVVNEQVVRLKKTPGFTVSAGELTEVKRAITDFMLTPNQSSYRELLLTYRRNVGDAGLTLGDAVEQINKVVSNAITYNKMLGSN